MQLSSQMAGGSLRLIVPRTRHLSALPFARKATSFDPCHLHWRLKATIYLSPLGIYWVVTPNFAKPEASLG